MIALIDGDIVAYRCAASLKIDDALDISNWRAAVLMKQILEETGASEYILFLSGGENVSHRSFVTQAWVDNPIEDLLRRLPTYRR